MIDLSKAKLFDSFRTFNGDVLQLTAIMPERDSIWKYILSNDKTYDTYTVNGEITPGLHSGKDLEAQLPSDNAERQSNKRAKLPIKLNDFCKQHHDNIVKKGFVERQHIGVLLMLTVSELSEALEADRKNKHANYELFENVYACGMEDLKDIMGFGSEYTLVGTQAEQKKYIGNAVEVNMATALCLALYKELN